MTRTRAVGANLIFFFFYSPFRFPLCTSFTVGTKGWSPRPQTRESSRGPRTERSDAGRAESHTRNAQRCERAQCDDDSLQFHGPTALGCCSCPGQCHLYVPKTILFSLRLHHILTLLFLPTPFVLLISLLAEADRERERFCGAHCPS